jgi:hypothetical protein
MTNIVEQSTAFGIGYHPAQEGFDASRIESSLFAKAKSGDKDAITSMFQSFIDTTEEEIIDVDYMGLRGLVGIGAHSFACVTNRRVADISYSPFSKEMFYQDAYLEY